MTYDSARIINLLFNTFMWDNNNYYIFLITSIFQSNDVTINTHQWCYMDNCMTKLVLRTLNFSRSTSKKSTLAESFLRNHFSFKKSTFYTYCTRLYRCTYICCISLDRCTYTYCTRLYRCTYTCCISLHRCTYTCCISLHRRTSVVSFVWFQSMFLSAWKDRGSMVSMENHLLTSVE